MEAIDVPDWNDFELRLKELRARFAGTRSSPLLFRGQSNSEWPLTTTLERAGCEGLPFNDYYLLITRVRPAIETFTGVNWDIPDYSWEVQKSFEDYEEFVRFPSVTVYRYMVYLRHHGFPSPLLDWSYSPYVAAFFAFRNSFREGGKRSIYVFCESPEGFKTWGSDKPRIRGVGPYIRSHRRHFRQQSDYTICGSFDQAWSFSPHETVFASTRTEQDSLWKFDLPSTERLSVLRQLNDYNLNAFSLFDSEESLLETMWFRERVLREQNQRV